MTGKNYLVAPLDAAVIDERIHELTTEKDAAIERIIAAIDEGSETYHDNPAWDEANSDRDRYKGQLAVLQTVRLYMEVPEIPTYPDRVMIGTRVSLTRKNEHGDVTTKLDVVGDWYDYRIRSDINTNVASIRAERTQELIGKKIGDVISMPDFEDDETEFNWIVTSIELQSDTETSTRETIDETTERESTPVDVVFLAGPYGIDHMNVMQRFIEDMDGKTRIRLFAYDYADPESTFSDICSAGTVDTVVVVGVDSANIAREMVTRFGYKNPHVLYVIAPKTYIARQRGIDIKSKSGKALEAKQAFEAEVQVKIDEQIKRGLYSLTQESVSNIPYTKYVLRDSEDEYVEVLLNLLSQ